MRQRVFKQFAPFAGVLAFAFAVGVGAELSNVHIVAFLSIIGVLALALTAALLTTGSGVRLFTLLVEGAIVGGAGVILVVGGAFLPYAARWGNRELYDFGGDAEWSTLLVAGLLFGGVIGTGIGAVCGVLAWALKRVQRRPNRGH